MKLETIYINLLDEGTPTLRRVQAESLGDYNYRLIEDSNYDPEDELWEFLPDTEVRCEEVDNFGEKILLAVEALN